MHVGGRITVFALSVLAGSLMIACFDLFHSTSDVRTACELDAALAGCGAGDAAEAETAFCSWTSSQARERAVHACSWLGACETPLGRNAFGPCVFQALLAFDCKANPNHHARLEAHRLWDCLQRAGSCVDVDTCVSQQAGTPVCSDRGDYTACHGDLRVHCVDGGVKPYAKASGTENCALWGKTCANGTDESECTGSSTGLSCHESDPKECTGTLLHWCQVDGGADGAGIDLGIDCANNGAGECGGFPIASDASWVACTPNGTDGGPDECTPDPAATCQTGRATSCLSGARETIDCATLLGAASGASACVEGTLSPPFDWTSPCAIVPSQCDVDSCDNMVVKSCERGATFSVNCAEQGLGPCSLQAGDSRSGPRAACSPP